MLARCHLTTFSTGRHGRDWSHLRAAQPRYLTVSSGSRVVSKTDHKANRVVGRNGLEGRSALTTVVGMALASSMKYEEKR